MNAIDFWFSIEVLIHTYLSIELMQYQKMRISHSIGSHSV